MSDNQRPGNFIPNTRFLPALLSPFSPFAMVGLPGQLPWELFSRVFPRIIARRLSG